MQLAPQRHRSACWVVRGCGRGRQPRIAPRARSGLMLRQAEGLLMTDRGLLELYGRAPGNFSWDDLQEATGQWVGLLADPADSTWVAMTDFHGFGHIFYQVHQRGAGQDVYLGTSLAALLHVLHADQITTDIDWPVALSTLASNHTLMRNHWSDRSLARDVRILPPDEMLVMTAAGVGTVSRPMTEDPAGRGYSELVSAGVERAVRQLETVAAAGFEDRRLYASGGKDTRVVMALMQHAGVLRSFRLASADPSRWAPASGRRALWQDLDVVEDLRRHYGLDWYVEPDYQSRMLSWDESLQHFLSYASGSEFTFPASRQLRRPEVPHVAVRGGAGELMRTAYKGIRSGPAWAVMEDRPDTLFADVGRLQKLVRSTATVPAAVRREARDAFREAFTVEQGLGISEQLNAHYRLHRNRTHFGHLLSSLEQGSLAFFPLAVPELCRAAHLLPFSERELGAVAFDVIEQLAPEINRIPFDSGTWPAELWRDRHGGLPDLPARSERHFDRDSFAAYFAQEDRNHDRRGRRSGAHRFDVRNATQVTSVDNLWALYDTAADPELMPEGFTRELARLAGLGHLNAASTTVLTATMRQVLERSATGPRPATTQFRVQPRWRTRLRLAGPDDSAPDGAVRTLNDIVRDVPGGGLEPFTPDPAAPFGVFCRVRLVGRDLHAERIGGDSAPFGFSHTFTAFRGTTEIAQVTAPGPSAVVARNLEAGRYRVVLSLAREDRPEVVYRPQSLWVDVPATLS